MQQEDKTQFHETEVEIARMAKDIEYIKLTMDELKKLIADVKDGYATKDQHTALELRVKNLESNQTWITRLIIGTVITAILGLIITIAK